jgi:hypothetical protein
MGKVDLLEVQAKDVINEEYFLQLERDSPFLYLEHT